ncbi:MAG: hypothetical protein ACMUIG_08705 [Thermoplasmatota archaeon]
MKGSMECTRGMETPVSIFLLIVAAGLVLSTVTFGHSPSSDDSEILRIRTIQAGSVGSGLLEYKDGGENSILIKMFIERHDIDFLQIIISPGSYNYSADAQGIDKVVESVIFTTPDRLPISILIYVSDFKIPPIEADHASWKTELYGIVLEIALPIHRISPDALAVIR